MCVEDCSKDNTIVVLERFKVRFPDKITIIRNKENLGAGKSRNVGVFETE